MDVLAGSRALRDSWLKLHANGRRAREAAMELGVSEAALVASACGPDEAALRSIPLGVSHARALFEALPSLGVVKTQTRSGNVVLEVVGKYPRDRIAPRFERWGSCFVLHETSKRLRRSSLQIFDDRGSSVHKVFLLRESDTRALSTIVHAHQAPIPPIPPAQSSDLGRSASGDPIPLSRLLRRLSSMRARGTIRLENAGLEHEHTFEVRRVTSKNDWMAIVTSDAKILLHRGTRALAHVEGETARVDLAAGDSRLGVLSDLPVSSLSGNEYSPSA